MTRVQRALETILNRLEGEVVALVPNITLQFLWKPRVVFSLLAIIAASIAASCASPATSPTDEAGIPNPASVHCEQSGGRLEFREDDTGGTYGVCIFDDDSECDEWAYFRGECGPADERTPSPPPQATNTAPPGESIDAETWEMYTHIGPDFSLRLPPDWVTEPDLDDPLLGGHLLNLYPEDSSEHTTIRVTFRRIGEGS